jgi:pentapeptide MXKDX repeat protein
MLKRKLRAAIVGSILLACTAIAPALASASSPTGTEVQQDKMKDDKMGQDKMGQDKMASNRMSHRRRRHRRHKKPMAGAKMDKMQDNKKP